MPLPPKYIALSLNEAYVTALEEKLAEYEYPLRTIRAVTMPLSVWDEREQQRIELQRQLQTLKDVPFDADNVINYAYEIVELVEKLEI